MLKSEKDRQNMSKKVMLMCSTTMNIKEPERKRTFFRRFMYIFVFCYCFLISAIDEWLIPGKMREKKAKRKQKERKKKHTQRFKLIQYNQLIYWKKNACARKIWFLIEFSAIKSTKGILKWMHWTLMWILSCRVGFFIIC